jgi:hypothetical protein
MKSRPALNHLRFAPCADALRLLITLAETAGCAVAGGVLASPAGFDFGHGCRPTPMNKMNLNRREIYRGKISLPKKSNHLEERTPSAPQINE